MCCCVLRFETYFTLYMACFVVVWHKNTKHWIMRIQHNAYHFHQKNIYTLFNISAMPELLYTQFFPFCHLLSLLQLLLLIAFFYVQFRFGVAIFFFYFISVDGLTTTKCKQTRAHTNTHIFITNISSPIKAGHKMRKRPLHRSDIVFILFHQRQEKHNQMFPQLQILCQNFNNYLAIRCVWARAFHTYSLTTFMKSKRERRAKTKNGTEEEKEEDEKKNVS